MDASSTKTVLIGHYMKMTLLPQLFLEQDPKAIRITRINFLKRKTAENGIKMELSYLCH